MTTTAEPLKAQAVFVRWWPQRRHALYDTARRNTHSDTDQNNVSKSTRAIVGAHALQLLVSCQPPVDTVLPMH